MLLSVIAGYAVVERSHVAGSSPSIVTRSYMRGGGWMHHTRFLWMVVASAVADMLASK